MGDALRGQKKDVTKFSIGINSDGTLTFHSTWPDLKLKKASLLEDAAAPSGEYEGSVPFIVDIKCTFNGDNTMDFDNNVKIQHQEIKCPKVPITVNGNTITFPNIQKTGDCMGDALRGQKKDVTKFSIGINSDGTLTFHSTWPDLKLKKQSLLGAGANPTHYGDPETGCESDEQAVQVQGVDGDFCSPACTGVLKTKCPSDVPSGVTAKPTCALKT